MESTNNNDSSTVDICSNCQFNPNSLLSPADAACLSCIKEGFKNYTPHDTGEIYRLSKRMALVNTGVMDIILTLCNQELVQELASKHAVNEWFEAELEVSLKLKPKQ